VKVVSTFGEWSGRELSHADHSSLSTSLALDLDALVG
jgi:hypothetical protein